MRGTPLAALTPSPPGWAVDWAALDATFEWVRALRGCEQSVRYHGEGDVWIHTRMVCEALAADGAWRALPESDRAEVFAAGLMHDIGKPATTRLDADGHISARGHSRVGARMARRVLWSLGVSLDARERVCAMIAAHQLPFFLVDHADAQRRAILASWRVRCDLLALVTRADGTGRRTVDQSRILDQVALFELYCEELGCLRTPYPFASDHSRFWYFRRTDRDPAYAAWDDTRCEATLLSGLPGAGKDHWIARHAGGLPVVSLDDLRRELGVDPRRSQGRVANLARERARVHLRASRDFVWNATNLSRDTRERLIALLADYNAHVKIVYLEAPEPVIRARNAARPSPVPGPAIDKMLRRWEVPDLTEAHDVLRLDSDG